MRSWLLLFYFFVLVTSQDFIRIDSPRTSEVVNSRHITNILYTVIGFNTVTPSLTNYYPSSLSVDFAWKEGNSNTSVSFQVTNGLTTAPCLDGSRNIERKETWKTPNCHFFSRYPPTVYEFSLVFTPVYSASLNVTGAPQSPIVVPLSIVVDNSTFPKC